MFLHQLSNACHDQEIVKSDHEMAHKLFEIYLRKEVRIPLAEKVLAYHSTQKAQVIHGERFLPSFHLIDMHTLFRHSFTVLTNIYETPNTLYECYVY